MTRFKFVTRGHDPHCVYLRLPRDENRSDARAIYADWLGVIYQFPDMKSAALFKLRWGGDLIECVKPVEGDIRGMSLEGLVVDEADLLPKLKEAR